MRARERPAPFSVSQRLYDRDAYRHIFLRNARHHRVCGDGVNKRFAICERVGPEFFAGLVRRESEVLPYLFIGRRDDRQAVGPFVPCEIVLNVIERAVIDYLVVWTLARVCVKIDLRLRDLPCERIDDLRPDDISRVRDQLLGRVRRESPGIFGASQHGDSPVDARRVDLRRKGRRANGHCRDPYIFRGDRRPGLLCRAETAAAVAGYDRVHLQLLQPVLKSDGLRARVEHRVGTARADLVEGINFAGRVGLEDAFFQLVVRDRRHKAAADEGYRLALERVEARRLNDVFDVVITDRRDDRVDLISVVVVFGNIAFAVDTFFGTVCRRRGDISGFPGRRTGSEHRDQKRERRQNGNEVFFHLPRPLSFSLHRIMYSVSFS